MQTNLYMYDPIGNRLFSAANAATNAYSANALNQYTAISGEEAVSPTCDSDGNTTWDGRFYHTWDAENRLMKSQPGGTVTNGSIMAESRYDFMSRRHSKTVRQLSGRGPGYPMDPSQAGTWGVVETRQYVYDGWNVIRETVSAAGNVATNHYVWGLDLSGSLQEAGGVGGLLAVVRNGTPYFPCYDANGNVTDYVDASGGVVAHREYDPFGNTTVATGALVHDLHFWFSTKYLDEETGLYYYGYRYYSPERGRWISRDLIEETESVLYIFNANSPINLIDYLGLTWKSILVGEDYYSGYYLTIVGVSTLEIPFKGGTATPEFTKWSPPVYEKNDQTGCYCVKDGTGFADVEVKWWKAKMGVPGVEDAKKTEEWKKVGNHKWKLWSQDDVGEMSEEVVGYINWHESIEVGLNGKLYENTIGISLKRIEENRCPNGGKKTKIKLDSYVKFDLAVKAYRDGVDKIKNAFDPRFAPKRVNKNGVERLVINTPTSQFDEKDFQNLLAPSIW